MSNRIYKGNLSTEGIQGIIDGLKKYADVTLPMLCDQVCRELAEMGIKVAEYTVFNEFKPYIEFRYDTKSLGVGELVAQDNILIHRVWYTSAEKNIRKKKEAWISPLLMSEYGAGPLAIDGHRGTFPGQKHAMQSEWSWFDESGQRHTSLDDKLMNPTQPMYRALVEMMINAEKVVREVFSSYDG